MADNKLATYTWSPWRVCGVKRIRSAASAWKRVETWNRKAACRCGAPQFNFGTCDNCINGSPRVLLGCDLFGDWEGIIEDRYGSTLIRYAGHDLPESEHDAQYGRGARDLTLADLRRDAFALFDRCHNLYFVVPTAHPENVRRMWPSHPAGQFTGPPRVVTRIGNVWLLCSASDQASLDAGLPHLLACRDLTPVLGLNLTLTGPVDFSRWTTRTMRDNSRVTGNPFWDFVRVGGETGRRARTCDADWIRSVVQQCRDAGVPCWVEQLGSLPRTMSIEEWPHGPVRDVSGIQRTRDPNGADPSEWPADLRVWQLPGGSK